MAKKKRVTRKQLLKEPDEFITTTGKLIRLAQTYRTQVTYTVGALLIILAAVSGYQYYANSQENRASVLLGQATANYASQKDSEGAQQAYFNTKDDFEAIIKKYSGTSAGKIAGVTLANICYNADAFDEAIVLYQRALRDFASDPFYRTLITNSIGYAQENKKDLVAATQTFEALTSEPDDFLKDEALFHLGEIYEAEGKPDKSRAVFEKLASEFPDSIYKDLISEKVSG